MTEKLDAFSRHGREQRRAWRRLTYAQRLRWLEQAKQFHAEALGAARRASAARAPLVDAEPNAEPETPDR